MARTGIDISDSAPGVQVGLDERTRSARTVFRRKLPGQSIKTVQAFADAAYYKPTKSILEML